VAQCTSWYVLTCTYESTAVLDLRILLDLPKLFISSFLRCSCVCFINRHYYAVLFPVSCFDWFCYLCSAPIATLLIVVVIVSYITDTVVEFSTHYPLSLSFDIGSCEVLCALNDIESHLCCLNRSHHCIYILGVKSLCKQWIIILLFCIIPPKTYMCTKNFVCWSLFLSDDADWQNTVVTFVFVLMEDDLHLVCTKSLLFYGFAR